MKVEICDKTRDAIIIITIGLAIVSLGYLIFKYNVAAYENGYTQKQLEHSTQCAWVKENDKDQKIEESSSK